MKNIVFLLSIFLLISCKSSNKKTVFICNDEEVIVKICTNTTQPELDSIQRILALEKRIIFDYSKTVFNSDQTIDILDFVVKGPEGYTCHNNTELYMNDDYQGFIRDYRVQAPTPFRCGLMN